MFSLKTTLTLSIIICFYVTSFKSDWKFYLKSYFDVKQNIYASIWSFQILPQLAKQLSLN